jgi:hypothetical protein
MMSVWVSGGLVVIKFVSAAFISFSLFRSSLVKPDSR